MAPVNGSFIMPRRTAVTGGRQAPKPVVPALPLRFVKPHAAQSGQTAAAAAVIPPASNAAAEPKDDDEEAAAAAANGAQQTDSNETETSLLQGPANSQHPIHAVAQGGLGLNHAATADAKSESVDGTPAPSQPSQPAMNGATVPGGQVTSPYTKATLVRSADPMAPKDCAAHPLWEISAKTLPKPHGDVASIHGKTQHYPVRNHSAKIASSHPPPSASPTRYQMPPQFQPAGRHMVAMANGDLACLNRPPLPGGPPHMHQAHPSSGSVHFGAFHDSQSSSPATPITGGIAPPPGMPIRDGRAPHMMQMNGNGFPPMLPYGAEMMTSPNYDSFGRPAAIAYGPMDYPAHGNALGLSTPHSFHDSQSSAHPEEGGMINQYPPGLRNGAGGPGDDQVQVGTIGRPYGPYDYPRMMPNPNIPPPLMISPGDNADSLLGHLQRQFASPELADCALELRYADDRAPPVRIPGHRLIFARSFRLVSLLRKQALQTAPADGSPQTLLIETASKWIRSDSFYMAVQRLYGLPLLHGPPQRNTADAGDVTDAGSANDQFEFAISYAAAGHLLEWNSVLRRGCEVATHLLSWQTLERALEFALEDHADKGIHESHKYGGGSVILLNAVVTFLVHNFPSHCHLDTESTEFVPYARLPLHPRPAPSTVVPLDSLAISSPPEVSVQLGKGRRSQKISGIQFGDLSFVENQTPKATQQAQPTSYAILSRILLDIPFTQLKMILESSGSGNVNGWANAEARYRIIKTAVDERESRRRRVVEAISGGRVPDAELIKAGLCSPEPRDLGAWTALGWQEEMLPFGNADGPTLSRKWDPLLGAQNSLVADYP